MYVIYFFDAVSISAGFTKPASILSEKIKEDNKKRELIASSCI